MVSPVPLVMTLLVKTGGRHIAVWVPPNYIPSTLCSALTNADADDEITAIDRYTAVSVWRWTCDLHVSNRLGAKRLWPLFSSYNIFRNERIRETKAHHCLKSKGKWKYQILSIFANDTFLVVIPIVCLRHGA